MEGTQSLAVFEGTLRCHGLFDFLLNESFRCHGDECDVPLLLAPAPFMHAALAAAPLRVLGAADGAVAGGGGGRGSAQHRFELRGVLPPWVVDRLACLLAVTQDGSFSLVADTHPLTLALNWRPGGDGGSEGPTAGVGPRDDFAAREAGCWDLEEAQRWRTTTSGLACNVLRELRCEGGTFVGHLSSRSAERAL